MATAGYKLVDKGIQGTHPRALGLVVAGSVGRSFPSSEKPSLAKSFFQISSIAKSRSLSKLSLQNGVRQLSGYQADRRKSGENGGEDLWPVFVMMRSLLAEPLGYDARFVSVGGLA